MSEAASTAATPSAAPTDAGPMGFGEFVALIALMVSIVAFAIDAMMPSLPEIGRDLALADPNDRQLVISVFILGLGLSPILFGIAGDLYGRKPAILGGFALFGIGCVLSASAQSFELLLIGRALQGIGAAGPRTLAVSIVRDRFEGRAMARVMSFVMMTFIIVPALAPAVGLGIESLAGWRAVFVIFFAFAALLSLWMLLRLPETHQNLAPPGARRPALRPAIRSIGTVLANRAALGYSIATGLIFSAFLSYLSAAEQILAEGYGLGDGFVVVFGSLALAVGFASLVNAALVMRLGMRRLAGLAFTGVTVWSGIFGLWYALAPPEALAVFLLWAFPSFFCFGILFGNLNALAMQPLGAVAGVGAALVGSIANVLSVPIAIGIARLYDGAPTPIIIAFGAMGVLGGLCALWAGAGRATTPEETP